MPDRTIDETLEEHAAEEGTEVERGHADPGVHGRAAAAALRNAPYQVGDASFYGRGDGFAGRTMANGAPMDPHAHIAAHRTLPLGTRVRVRRVDTGAEVVVTIADRGPYAKNRILDCSPRVADELGFTSLGHARVAIYRL